MILIFIGVGSIVLCLIAIKLIKHHRYHHDDDNKAGKTSIVDDEKQKQGNIIRIRNIDTKKDIISSASNSPLGSRDNSLIKNIDIASDIV